MNSFLHLRSPLYLSKSILSQEKLKSKYYFELPLNILTTLAYNVRIGENATERKTMKKKRKNEFLLAIVSYFAVCILDLTLTYIATPNLYLEGNPLISYFNIGWGGLISINLLTFAFYVAIAYYAFVGYTPPVSKETNIRRYLADINYGDPDKTVPMMWKLPKFWAPQIACLCWSIALALPVSRLIIVFEWLLLILRIRAQPFFAFVALFPGGRIDLFVAIILAWILSFVWIQREFKKNLINIQNAQE